MAVQARRETRLEQLQRLAEKGACEGVEVQQLNRPGMYTATSSRDGHPGYLVQVYADSIGLCTCEGFEKHRACKHYALALGAAGIMTVAEWVTVA